MQESSNVLRHLISTISYRFSKVNREADCEFYLLESKNGIRRPVDIINHMSNVMTYFIAAYDNSTPDNLSLLNYKDELDRFYQLLERADFLISNKEIPFDLKLKLIQGPLSDVLTHIGQIGMLRRYFNDPVKGENFMKASIKEGFIDKV